MSDFRQAFLEFALAREVLCFGEFVTKAGRKTPYFFNAGAFAVIFCLFAIEAERQIVTFFG